VDFIPCLTVAPSNGCRILVELPSFTVVDRFKFTEECPLVLY
jgi:hypothetical protein